MATLILLVSTDLEVRQRIESLLSEAGYLIASAASLPQAKRLLDNVRPDLVIAELRLGAYNGLHLAVRCRTEQPSLPVIITDQVADATFKAEAERLGAVYVVNPLENPDFLTSVKTTIEERRRTQQPVRRWPRKQIAPVAAEFAARSARICDVSYGGLRLAYGEQQQVPREFDLTVPARGLTVRLRSVWSDRSPVGDEFWCGAELIESGMPRVADWREFVDAT